MLRKSRFLDIYPDTEDWSPSAPKKSDRIPRHLYVPERKHDYQKIKEMFEKGKTRKEITIELKTHSSTVSRILRSFGIRTARRSKRVNWQNWAKESVK